MARKIHNIEEVNRFVTKTQIRTIITFRNQQLLDLWLNEMSGQISDGMWENSNKTEWLWRNVWLQLGDETRVEVDSLWVVGRKSFGMTGELWDIIGDRIMDENGFETEKEAKKAWREIAKAIYNVTRTKAVDDLVSVFKADRKKDVDAQKPELRKEWEEVGIEETKYTTFSTFATYIEQETKKGYISVEAFVDRENNLKTRLSYDDKKYIVSKGHLKEALEALRTFATTMAKLRA